MVLPLIRLMPSFAKAFRNILKFHKRGEYNPGPMLKKARNALGLNTKAKKSLAGIEGKIALYEKQINSMLRNGKKPDLKMFEKQINIELQRFGGGSSLGAVEKQHLSKAMLEIRNQIRDVDLKQFGKLTSGKRISKQGLNAADEVFGHTSSQYSGSVTAANKIIKQNLKSDEFKKRLKNKTIKY